MLGGITRKSWRELKAANEIDPAFRGRAALLGLLAGFNGLAAGWEERKYGGRIAATEIKTPPLFLLGHWRSGTTWLHQLLCLDPQFGYVSSLQAIHPSTSLVTGRLFGGDGVRKRPMDNVLQGAGSPQEDEFAVATRSLVSPFLGFVFPRRASFYDRFLNFDDGAPSEVDAWKKAMLTTVRKATMMAGGRPLVLKSPPHTARIRLLLELFPDARFVHLHRNPFDVFRSNLALNDTLAWHSYLQVPRPEDLVEAALRRYRLMFAAYFRDQPLIPAGRFFETSYAELVRHPVETLDDLYRGLSLPGFAAFRPVLARHLAAQPSYGRREHAALPAELRDRIAAEAGGALHRWGYSAKN